MAYSEGQLDGYADYRVGIYIALSSQNAAGNYSTFYWEVRLVNGNGSAYNNDSTQYWSASVGGQSRSGTFKLLQANRYDGTRVVGSGYVDVGHNSDGTRPGFANNAYIDTDHENVGDGGSGDAWVDAPTFSRIPAAPTFSGFDAYTATSFGVIYSRGSATPAIDYDSVQYSTASDFSTIAWDDSPSGTPAGSPSGYSNGSGLGVTFSPNTTYYVRLRSHNSQGWGPYTSAGSTKTLMAAPTFSTWTQDSTGGLKGSWSAPANPTGITGYRLTIATNDTFTANVQDYDLGLISSYTVTGKIGGRTYYAKVAAKRSDGVQAYSPAKSTTLVLSAGDLDGWTRLGSKPTNINYFTTEGIRRGTVGTKQALYLESLSTGSASIAADALGMQRTVATVTGSAYRFYASMTGSFDSAPTASQGTTYRLAVGSTSGTAVTLPSATGTVDLPYVEFVAASTSTAVKVLLAQSLTISGSQDAVERVAFHSIRVEPIATDYPVRLRSTVYESSLANHLDLAANSAGATWYVDKSGVTRITLPGSALPVSAVFSDQTEPGALSYVDVSAGYDTSSTVNRLVATNYGIDPVTGLESNHDLLVEDAQSESLFGVLEEDIDTNLYEVAPYDSALATRLSSIISARSQPQLLISSLTWNAQQDLTYARSLEVGQRIIVRFNGTSQNSQIVNIKHDITPTRWLVTLNIQKL